MNYIRNLPTKLFSHQEQPHPNLAKVENTQPKQVNLSNSSASQNRT